MTDAPRLIKFGLIHPATETLRVVQSLTIDGALTQAGLTPGTIDHGVVVMQHGMIVSIVGYEWSLMESEPWFAIGPALYAGNAILYQESVESGKLQNLALNTFSVIRRNLRFFKTRSLVETAIARGEIERPYTAVNGEKLWEF